MSDMEIYQGYSLDVMIRVAADSGATVWSTGGYYGKPGDGLSNLRMVGKFFKKVRLIDF